MNLLTQGLLHQVGLQLQKHIVWLSLIYPLEKKRLKIVLTEVARFQSALAKSKTELEAIRDHAEKELGADKAAIFDAHVLVLTDPELIGSD